LYAIRIRSRAKIEILRSIIVPGSQQPTRGGATINSFQTQEKSMINSATARRDEAMFKGAMEDDGNPSGAEPRRQLSSFADQLGHRDQDEMLKDNDTDFPEPDAKAEITGK
jgi:hypothetical protein